MCMCVWCVWCKLCLFGVCLCVVWVWCFFGVCEVCGVCVGLCKSVCGVNLCVWVCVF